MGPLHTQILDPGMELLMEKLHLDFVVDGQPGVRWKGLFDFREGNNLGSGGFVEDFAGTVEVRPSAAEAIPLREGLRLTAFDRNNRPMREVQVRDIVKQPTMWTCTLASPNQ